MYYSWKTVATLCKKFINYITTFVLNQFKIQNAIIFLHPMFDLLLSRKVTVSCFLNPISYLLLIEENNSWMFCKQNNNTLKLLAPTFFYCTNRSTNIFLHVCDTVSTISYCSIFVVKIMDVIWAWNPVEQMILH